MKGLLLSLIISFSLTADEDFYHKKFNVIEAAQLRVAVNHFYELSEKALTLRGRLLQFVNLYQAEKDKVLTGKDLEEVLTSLKSQLKLRDSLYKFIQTYKSRPFLKIDESVLYSDENILKGGMIAIAAASVLYDNYTLCLSIVQDNSKLRRLLNKGDKGLEIEEDAFEEIVDSFHSPKNRSLMRDAMEWYTKKIKMVDALSNEDKQVKYLKSLLESSPSIRDIQDGFGFGDYVKLIGLVKFDGKDSIAGLGSGSMGGISKVFGNSIGMVQTRDGKLFNNKSEVAAIKKHLKPLDIILEKTPFRLTDKFIPGHFGHVAIWMGSEKELKDAGLWEHPSVKPWQKQISEGKCVLEALRDGVQLNTFEKFMDVDDVAIIRAEKLEYKETALRGCSLRAHGK